MNDNSYLSTIRPEGGLYVVAERITVTAGAILSGNFTVRKQRGNVQGIGISIGSDATSIELANTIIDLANNGKSFIETDSALRYSDKYREERSTKIPICIQGGGVIDYTIDNTNSSKDIVVVVNQYFYDCLQNFNILN
jgi:hypothetical protein